MFKNTASQKCIVYAFDSTTNLPKTGDAANLTAYVSKDYGAVTVLGDTTATEMDSTNAKGYYLFDLTQAETNADTLLFSAKSSTANIVVLAMPATVYTTPANFTALAITSGGIAQADVQTIKTQTVTCGAGVTVGAFVGNATAAIAIDASGRVDVGKILGTASAGAVGYVGVDWGAVTNKTTTNALTGTTIASTQKVDVDTIKTNPVVNAGTITFPTGATLASTTNITAGTITTVTTVTNQLTAAQIATGVWQDTTAGDFTVALSIGKSIMNGVSLGTGLTVNDLTTKSGFSLSSTGMDSVTLPANIITATSIAANAITAAKIATDAIDADALATDAIAEIWAYQISSSFAASTALLVAATGGLGQFSVNDASATTTSFVTNLTSAVDDFYRDMQLTFTSGALAGQIRVIASYTGATKTVTLDEALTSAPANGVTFVVSGPHTHTVSSIATAVWTDTTAGDFTVASSIGKSIMNGVALGTGLTINAYAGNTPQTGDSFARIGATGSGLTSLAPSATALSTATWTGTLATNLTTLASHDPGATIGTSTLTQTQVTGGAYALNSASFSFASALDFTTTQKASLITQIWDGTTSGHTTGGTFGGALNSAGSAGDPWSTALPGAYVAGSAGYIVGTNLDATVSGRMATYTQPTGFLAATFPSGTIANTTNITAGTITTTTNLTNAPPDSAGVTTLLTRIPAALFSGITSLAQWLGLLGGKQVGNTTARTEMRATGAGSGTFDETTDSQEALRDRGDAAWGSSGGLTQADVRTAIGMASANLDTQLAGLAASAGAGAWTVTLTINDGSSPLESANVRLTKGAETYATTTNVSGIATLHVDSGTWTVTATLFGYTFAGATLAISADTSHTYSMTAITITPSAAGFTTGYLTALDADGNAEPGVTFTSQVTYNPTAGIALDTAVRSVTSDGSGLVQFPGLLLGATYRIRRGTSGLGVSVKIPTTAGTTYELPAVIGSP